MPTRCVDRTCYGWMCVWSSVRWARPLAGYQVVLIWFVLCSLLSRLSPQQTGILFGALWRCHWVKIRANGIWKGAWIEKEGCQWHSPHTLIVWSKFYLQNQTNSELLYSDAIRILMIPDSVWASCNEHNTTARPRASVLKHLHHLANTLHWQTLDKPKNHINLQFLRQFLI